MSRSWPSPARQLLVLTGLTGFAISQPVLAILGDAPTELAVYGLEGWSVVVLACLIAFGPPLVVWAISRGAAALGRGLDRWLHLIAVGGLVGLLAVQVAKAAGLDGGVVAGLAAAAGAAFAVAYVRFPPVAAWASYTAVLPVMAVVFFTFASPASALLTSEEAPERSGAGDHPSVVLIVLDEFPTRSILTGDDEIDVERYPNLAELASESTWYRHATTPATLTQAAVPSILTSQLPSLEEATAANHPDNLFTLLAPTHELEVLEQATKLCPYEQCEPTPAGAEGREAVQDAPAGLGFSDLLGITRDLWLERVSLDPPAPAALDDFPEAVTTDEAASDPTVRSVRADTLIGSFDPDKGPALYFLHLMLPHRPWIRYADGHEYTDVEPLGTSLPPADQGYLHSWSPWTSTVSEQQHLLQAQYADTVVGEVVDGLRDSGLYDDSLVIVTADHGITFEPDTYDRYVERSSIDGIAYVPLFVKAPGQRSGGIDDSNVTSLDLLPTIAAVTGTDIPWSVEGAPVGSKVVADRGGAKRIFAMVGTSNRTLEDILDYEDKEVFRTVGGQRFVGELPDPDDPLSALNAALGLGHDLLGARLDDLVDDRRGSVSIKGLDELRRPQEDEPPLGVVRGRVTDPPDGATLLLAVDGVVVGGSQLSTDADGGTGHLAVLLPYATLDDDNDIRIALVVGGEIVELDVTSG